MEARRDFWRKSGSLIVIIFKRNKNCTCHRKARFLSHSIKLTLSGGHTTLDVLQGCQICDYVNVDGGTVVFTQFTLLNGTPPKRITCSPEIWLDMSNKSQRKEKQHWEEEKAKPDNAQRPSGIYFVDLEDKEFHETLKKLRGSSWKCTWTLQCRAHSERPHGIHPGRRLMVHKRKFVITLARRDSIQSPTHEKGQNCLRTQMRCSRIQQEEHTRDPQQHGKNQQLKVSHR